MRRRFPPFVQWNEVLQFVCLGWPGGAFTVLLLPHENRGVIALLHVFKRCLCQHCLPPCFAHKRESRVTRLSRICVKKVLALAFGGVGFGCKIPQHFKERARLPNEKSHSRQKIHYAHSNSISLRRPNDRAHRKTSV